MKVVLIICDGLADRTVQRLNRKTPLEAATKPALDALAHQGINGLMYTLSPGVPPGSDTGHLAIFGYDPYKVYTGRGAFEAIGAGLDIQRGDVAFRSNLATVDEKWNVLDRRAGRISTREGIELTECLKNIHLKEYPNVKIIYDHTTEHRGALILREPDFSSKNFDEVNPRLRGILESEITPGLSSKVSDSDPEEDATVQNLKPLDNSPEASRTADIVNTLTKEAYRLLQNNPLNQRRIAEGLPPANIILVRGAGSLPTVTPLANLYGIKSACIAANALVKGVAVAVGLQPINVPEATGTVASNLKAKAEAALKFLDEYDFLFIHVKGSDNASHDGALEQKMDMIRKIDEMAKILLDNLDMDSTLLALTADHATPVELKHHTGDPVPLTIVGPGVLTDEVTVFSERHCATGSLGVIRGQDLMPILMNYIGKTKKFGA